MTKHALRFDDAICVRCCRLAQIACDDYHYLHKEKVEQNHQQQP
jgi:hypothetical protein